MAWFLVFCFKLFYLQIYAMLLIWFSRIDKVFIVQLIGEYAYIFFTHTKIYTHICPSYSLHQVFLHFLLQLFLSFYFVHYRCSLFHKLQLGKQCQIYLRFYFTRKENSLDEWCLYRNKTLEVGPNSISLSSFFFHLHQKT